MFSLLTLICFMFRVKSLIFFFLFFKSPRNVYSSSVILRSFLVTSSIVPFVELCGINVTSCVSDSAVSRFVRLCVETADGSGDVSVIRDPYAGLCVIKKSFCVILCFFSFECLQILTYLESRAWKSAPTVMLLGFLKSHSTWKAASPVVTSSGSCCTTITLEKRSPS